MTGIALIFTPHTVYLMIVKGKFTCEQKVPIRQSTHDSNFMPIHLLEPVIL